MVSQETTFMISNRVFKFIPLAISVSKTSGSSLWIQKLRQACPSRSLMPHTDSL